MPFLSIHSHIVVARNIMDKYAVSNPEISLFKACAQGLSDIADNIDSYTQAIKVTFGPFYAGFVKNLHSITNLYSANSVPTAKEAKERTQELAFVLFEEVALFVRERHLKSTRGGTSAEGYAVMTFFENSGNWLPSDQTKVCEYYYSILPVKMIPSISERIFLSEW